MTIVRLAQDAKELFAVMHIEQLIVLVKDNQKVYIARISILYWTLIMAQWIHRG
jgi:hypothetical protein